MEDKKAKDMKRYIVFLKQVPLSTKVEMDPVTRTLKRSSAMTRTNPDDLYALQLAVKLKRQTGAEIVAVSMGPASAEEVLREALQRGAEAIRGVRAWYWRQPCASWVNTTCCFSGKWRWMVIRHKWGLR